MFTGMSIIGVLAVIFWIFMFIDCITNQGLQLLNKVIWAVIITVFPFLGPLAYFIIVKNLSL